MADITNRAWLPMETTPLNRAASGSGSGKASRFSSETMNSLALTLLGVSLVFGLAPAIVTLYIYYSNGGEAASCSQPLPSWLFWQGYVSAINAFLPVITIPLLCLSTSARDTVQNLVKLLGGPLNLFLFIWFIVGCVEVFSTDVQHCDEGLYNGAKVYIIIYLTMLPLIILCGCWFFYCLANDADRASEELLRKGPADHRTRLRPGEVAI